MSRSAKPFPKGIIPPVLCPELLPLTEEYRNPWFRVMNRGSYYTLEYDRPQVVVLPVVEEKDFLLVRVNRPVIGDIPLELPAGDSMPGETLQEAAQRELKEETGIEVKDLSRFIPLIPISEMPGRIPVLLTVFQVDLTPMEYLERNVFDEEEIKSVELIGEREIIHKIAGGEIYLSSPMAIIARYILAKHHGLDNG